MSRRSCGRCTSEVPPGVDACPICGSAVDGEIGIAGRFRTAGATGGGPPGAESPGFAGGGRSGLAGGAATLGAVLLGVLTKGGAFLSLLAAFGVYWSLWGWKFAAGFVISLWIHEMGHVLALRKEGIAATAPMFIPGLGAFVRMKEHPKDALQDARIGLAGPLAGLLAAAGCAGIAMATESRFFGVLAGTGAMLNLFNLLPVWQLDGSRGVRPLGAGERLAIAAAFALAAWVTGEKLFFLFAIAAGFRAFRLDEDSTGDSGTLVAFLGILGALTALLVLYPVRS